jgi:hypothetical protein
VTGAPGVAAELVGGAAQVDEGARPLFQSKCTTCHEPRSPANRSMSPEQWASTVDRMIKSRGAEINDADKARIVGYLQALAKAGQVGVRVRVQPDAAPGMRELRVVTGQGASTAYTFEVGTVPEVMAAPGNDKATAAQKVALPVVVNGALTKSGERQYFAFDAKKGQRLSLSLRAFRLNEQCAAYFNPVLYLYDAQGRTVAKSLGRVGVDPVIDFVAPEDGAYTLLVRDLIWKGSPSSVYRLALGGGPVADGVLSPAVAAPGARLAVRMMPADGTDNAASAADTFAVRVPDGAEGVTMVTTPMGGEAPILVRDLPDGGGPNSAATAVDAVALPALFRGNIAQAGQTDTFRVRVRRGGGGLEVYARRLGSPLRPRVTVKDTKGRVVAGRAAVGDDDLRVPNAFPAPGEYTVEVTDADGAGGAAFAYCWEALDGTPDFQLTTTPDVVNLAPGASTVLTVRAARRENLQAPVRVTVRGLPPGVTAGEAVLLPGMETTVVPLTAAPGATIAAGAITVEGRTTDAEGAVVTRRARPIEVYRVNNNAHSLPRGTGVVAVTSDTPPFALSVTGGAEGDMVALTPGGEAKLTIQVLRQNNFKGEVQLAVMGLPSGITGPNTVNLKAGQDQATVTLRASGDARILRDKPAPGAPVARFVIAGYLGGGGFGSYDGAPAAVTGPIALVSK